MRDLSLLGTLNRVEAPFIKVTIGDYTFGVYSKEAGKLEANGFYQAAKIVYPNYVKRLNVQKINGQVNTYTLELVYAITPTDDPNFFEKVFSSVSKTRKIVFSYGDAMTPSYIYKEEEAIITAVNSSFSMKSSSITYTVTAISKCVLATSGCFTFANQGYKKPSDEIKRILYDPQYGLLDVFTGMAKEEYVQLAGLIPGNDQAVELQTQQNMSVFDYLSYLVSCMIPDGESPENNKQKTFYILTVVDLVTASTVNVGKLTADELGGPFFKIVDVSHNIQHSDAYEIDIGFPSKNIVVDFSVSDNQNYSIFYDWQKELIPTDYVTRIDNAGQWEEVYAPVISSKNQQHETRINDATWWTKLTEFPISASITIRGLLRPAILMSYVRLNVFYYGNKHIASGLYIITKQVDTVDERGYRTQLSLTRISGDEQ